MRRRGSQTAIRSWLFVSPLRIFSGDDWSARLQRSKLMISRRVFLKDGAFALVSLGFAPSFLSRTALAAGTPTRAKRLIAIFQRGACDGLSIVVPFGDADYYRARPSIAVTRPGGSSD